jgi:hypothetical protein
MRAFNVEYSASMHAETEHTSNKAPVLARATRHRCPGNQAKPLKTCNIFAADFADDGIIAPCNSTVVLSAQAAQAAGKPAAVGALVRWVRLHLAGPPRSNPAVPRLCAHCRSLEFFVRLWSLQASRVTNPSSALLLGPSPSACILP